MVPESVPDSAYVAGTEFSCALIEDNCELHFITSLELQTVLYFFHVEEQFLAFTNFICDEAKLRRRRQIQRKEISTWQIQFAEGGMKATQGKQAIGT